MLFVNKNEINVYASLHGVSKILGKKHMNIGEILEEKVCKYYFLYQK